MIAVDTNIMVYAHRPDSPFHRPAAATLKALAEGLEPWAIPWPCVHEFISIVTHPRVFRPPSPLGVAIGQVDAWMASPSVVLVGESDRHWRTLADLAARAKLMGPSIHDARIVAICIDHGVTELWSADRDFSRFPGLRVVNPLVGGPSTS